MTPLHAWLRGLSSDSCGPFRGAWATDARRAQLESDQVGIDWQAFDELRERFTDAVIDDMVAQTDAMFTDTDAIAAQRIGEVVGRLEGV